MHATTTSKDQPTDPVHSIQIHTRAEAVGDVGKAQEKLLNKRAMALQKRDASLKKIQVRDALVFCRALDPVCLLNGFSLVLAGCLMHTNTACLPPCLSLSTTHTLTLIHLTPTTGAGLAPRRGAGAVQELRCVHPPMHACA